MGCSVTLFFSIHSSAALILSNSAKYSSLFSSKTGGGISRFEDSMGFDCFDELASKIDGTIIAIVTSTHISKSLSADTAGSAKEPTIKTAKIKIKILGYKRFSLKLNRLLNLAEKKTCKNTKLQINLALNYGSKSELISAFKELGKNKELINEKNIKKYLQTKDIPDPEILIRTGNTKRLSNFLLWQLAYSEIFFEKKLWPDFNEKDYIKIIKNFKKIKRNFGKI